MPNTFFGLTIGTTGLYGANIGINTTAHNISNTETDGYTRQLVEKRAGTALRTNASYGMIGTGVDIISIEQVRDQYYDEKYRSNNTNAGYYTCQDYYMKDVENYFNEVQLEGFNANFDTLYNSIQELSKDPSSLTVRTQLNSYAQSFSEYVNSLQVGMEKIQDNVNLEIKTMVDSVNSYALQIAGLTKQINTLEVTGGKANDLRDQRNLLVDELSNIVNISVDEKIVGLSEVGVTSYTVKIGETTLVDTFDYHTMHVVPRTEKMNQSDIEGLYDIAWESNQTFNPLANGGRLQALFEVRDGNNQQYFNGRTTASYGENTITVTDTSVNKVEQLHIAETGIITVGNRDYVYNGFQVTTDDDGNFVYEFELKDDLKKDVDDVEVAIGKSIAYKGINYYMQQLDEFARVFTKAFNDIHKSGRDLNNEAGLDYFNSRNKVSGENYVFDHTPNEKDYNIVISSKTGMYAPEEGSEFEHYGSYYMMTAGRMCVTDEIYADPSKVAAASDVVNGVSQNDIALQMIALKSDTRMFKQGTPSGFLQALIAELGIDAAKAKSFAQNNEDILSTIQNQRLSVSGVDMDEESMALVRFQNAYNLSAKVISTMNELYDRLINYMGA
ncbi:MAG: flagellar hook-associated protein FlgK [Lachnospiraceae bacterium]|nr:flagellar hook-associated protein FlgK [Lachnospiraceae bacterium]